MNRWVCVLLMLLPLAACEEEASDLRSSERLDANRARVILHSDLADFQDLILVARLETPVRVVTQRRFGVNGSPEELVFDVRPEEYKISVEVRRASGDAGPRLLDVCHDFVDLKAGDIVEPRVDGVPSECAIVYEAEVDTRSP
jgi:hypothetical protein